MEGRDHGRSQVAALKRAIADVVAMGGSVAEVSEVCVAALPGDGAAITFMTSDAARDTVCATDDVIRQVERVQYTLGDGPTLQAFNSRRPVLVPDLASTSSGRWLVLAGELAALPVGALFAFPLRLGAISLGVCTLYGRATAWLSREELAFVLTAVDLTTLALLEKREGAPPRGLDIDWWSIDGHARSQVHQATGMLIAQLGVNAEMAFARLRAHAFATSTDIEQVADDIVCLRLRMEAESS